MCFLTLDAGASSCLQWLLRRCSRCDKCTVLNRYWLGSSLSDVVVCLEEKVPGMCLKRGWTIHTAIPAVWIIAFFLFRHTRFREWIKPLQFPKTNTDGASALPPRTLRASNPMGWLGNPCHSEVRMQPVYVCLICIYVFLYCNRDKKIKKEERKKMKTNS